MKKLFILAAALCAVMLSCTEGEEPADTPTPTPTPDPTPEAQIKIPINLSIGGGFTRANDTTFENGDKVGLYVVNYNGETAGELTATSNHVNNMQFTYTDGTWTPSSPIYWKDETTHADFYVYYPYMTEEQLVTNEFSVKTDQSDEANYWASDYLWGKATNVAPTENPVPIITTHALSNVLIYIKAGEGFTPETLAESITSVTINNVKATATVNIKNGMAEALGEPTTIIPWNTGEYFRAMVVPQVVEEGTELITVVFEDTEYTLTTGATFETNKQHTYTINVRKTVDGIDFGIGDWETEDNAVGVTTVCGTGYAGQKMGTFSEAEISPYYVVADHNGNLFCSSRNQSANGGAMDNHSFIRIDMINREVSMLADGCIPNSPACDIETGIVSVPTEAYTGSFIEFNPLEMWTPNFKEFTWDPNNTDVPRMPWKHCMVVNPSDGMIYTRYYFGHIARINPETLEAELVCKTGQFDTYGMCFRPSEPNVLYFTNYQSHRIYKLDMNLPKEQWEAIQINGGTGVAGHRDGALAEALFNNPAQMCCDAEGNIYVADQWNHCIRRINADNTVETVLGIPGKAGYQDGDVETALLNRPRGVAIDQNNNLYIADFGNAKIRKMKID